MSDGTDSDRAQGARTAADAASPAAAAAGGPPGEASARRSPREWRLPSRWIGRAALGLLVLVAFATMWWTNEFLTARFTEDTRNRARLRLALYSGNLVSELGRNAVIPQLLARDPVLVESLRSADFSTTSQRLISYASELGAASITLMDGTGRVVAASDRKTLGRTMRERPEFVEPMRASQTVFTVAPRPGGGYVFAHSRKVVDGKEVLGVISVEADLGQFERAWAGISDAVFVANSEGRIILATEPRWRGLTEAEALRRQPPRNAIERAIRSTADWTALPADAYLSGEAMMRSSARIPFRGWQIASFTNYASVRERVNGFLALELMGFSLLLALVLYAMSRRTALRMAFFQRESADLRALNRRLQQEIAERERVERTLQVAEQTLQQSSKLAALGEMSAAVSHELNQPLAAMKTYLAGARLLIGRNRSEEALAAFQRIDGLIERMGRITRQLKSYARGGSDGLQPVNLVDVLHAAVAMMEPQLKHRQVRITLILPDEPVMVLGDRLRLEQVVINLLRNALDATKAVDDPQIEVILAKGSGATLSVRDNGHGIEDFERLFEPFFTTKRAGEGVGLGLAISSGIVTDLGGRLTARNAETGGAVFELHLPLLADGDERQNAAE